MAKNKNLKVNTEVNFTLRGFNSIQIGLYLILFAYLTESILNGFLSDSSMLGMMSIQIIETQIVLLACLFGLFSYLALFFSSRRRSRKHDIKFWNAATRSTFLVVFVSCIATFGSLFYLNSLGFYAELTAIFCLLYGLFLILFNFRKKKALMLLGGVCLMLAIINFVIPSYWYPSLLIIGAGHVVYGLMVKN